MRLIATYALILVVGFVIAYGLGLLGGLLWPAAALPITLIVSAWWIWTGWKYAVLRDRAREAAANLSDGPAPRHVPAITGIFWVAVAVAVIALWPAPEGVLYWVRGALFAVTFLFGLDSLRIALFAPDAQIRRAVDGDAEARAEAHRELQPPGLVYTLGRLISSRRFVLMVISAAVAAFFFINQYVPPWGAVGNILRGEILVTAACVDPFAKERAKLDLMDEEYRREYFALMTPEERQEFDYPYATQTNFFGMECGKSFPYRWVALTAVLIVGAHLISRAGWRA